MASFVVPRVPRRLSSYHENTASISSIPTCGYDEEIFVNPPGEDLHCPICMLVLREPHLLSCCGKHLCKVCISRIKNTGSASCPCCRDEDFHSMLNKEKRRVVLGLKIYCANKDKGCTWTGELGEGERHLETRCDYVPKGCPYGCGQLVPKNFLKDHTTHKCAKRPIEVQLESLKQEMTAELLASETKYEKKVAMLEKKIRQQEAKIVQQDKELAIQEDQLFIQAEELKKKKCNRQNISYREIKEEKRFSQVVLPDFNNDNPLENALVEAIFSLQENDPSFTELKLNNYCYRVDFKFFEQVMMALKNNCYVKNVSLVNLDLVDKHATVLAEVIRGNVGIRVLNVESNRFSGEGIRSIVNALWYNATIKEVRIANQSENKEKTTAG